MWPKCPKCKAQNVRIIELWTDMALSWDYGERQDQGVGEAGHPYKVEGRCLVCDHRWRMRGIIQIKPEWWEPSGLTCVRADGCADNRLPDAKIESGAAAAQLDR